METNVVTYRALAVPARTRLSTSESDGPTRLQVVGYLRPGFFVLTLLFCLIDKAVAALLMLCYCCVVADVF